MQISLEENISELKTPNCENQTTDYESNNPFNIIDESECPNRQSIFRVFKNRKTKEIFNVVQTLDFQKISNWEIKILLEIQILLEEQNPPLKFLEKLFKKIYKSEEILIKNDYNVNKLTFKMKEKEALDKRINSIIKDIINKFLGFYKLKSLRGLSNKLRKENEIKYNYNLTLKAFVKKFSKGNKIELENKKLTNIFSLKIIDFFRAYLFYCKNHFMKLILKYFIGYDMKEEYINLIFFRLKERLNF